VATAAVAIKIQRRMKHLGMTTALAARMDTSRNQIHRILDERDAGITLKMLFRLAGALGMPLRIGFGAPAPAESEPPEPATGTRGSYPRK
jgi:transcriptional regulator with XRE-family HTH domain